MTCPYGECLDRVIAVNSRVQDDFAFDTPNSCVLWIGWLVVRHETGSERLGCEGPRIRGTRTADSRNWSAKAVAKLLLYHIRRIRRIRGVVCEGYRRRRPATADFRGWRHVLRAASWYGMGRCIWQRLRSSIAKSLSPLRPRDCRGAGGRARKRSQWLGHASVTGSPPACGPLARAL